MAEPAAPESREDVLREAMVAIGRDPNAEETDRDDEDASWAEMTVEEPPPRVSPRAPPAADAVSSNDSAPEGSAAWTASTRPPSPLSPLSPSLPSPPPLTPPPPPPPAPDAPPPPAPDAPPPPAPDAPPPPAPKYYRPPAMFDPLVSLPGVESDGAPLMHDGDVASLGRTDHLAVVSAYWEVHDERWRSKTRSKPAEYYRRGLHNLAAAGRSGKSCGVHRRGVERLRGARGDVQAGVQTSGRGGSSGGKSTASEVHLREASATKASLRRLAPRGSLSGAEHAVRGEDARHETHLAQQDQPRGICGAHADPQGRRARDADGVGGRGSALGAER